eukprot:TRINITY_DN1955_c0_g1_i3.p1 TRINITY_DN1955_c0_g1~~TRINITY_DN1955_c0_g1_i3.p1  ORF type:complete len:317 (+),score=70.04 TRINITY_DN1955_c0_g1_i3:341-1291(+)
MVLDMIDGISSLRVYIPSDLTTQDRRQTVHNTLSEVEERFVNGKEGGIPLLDPLDDLGIEDKTFSVVLRKAETLEAKLKKDQFLEINKQDLKTYEERAKCDEEIKDLKRRIRQTEDVILKDEMGYYTKFLKKLGYLSKDDIVEVKGRFSTEINAANEILATELVFCGFFNKLNHFGVAAILSCLVFQEKADGSGTSDIPAELVEPYKEMIIMAKKIAEVKRQCKLISDVDKEVASIQPHLIHVVYAWAQGASFASISGMVNVFEGTLIRTFKQLEELLRQLESGAKRIGNQELMLTFRQASAALKRDIVFAASLYL